jgi:glycosyltransferase involved in cell wall biosynthesis
MAETLNVLRAKVEVVPLGLDLAGHGGPRAAKSPGEPLTVGYFARICPEKGLHHLVEAFHRLAADSRFAGRVRLRVAGYLGERDKKYLADLEARLAAWGLASQCDVVGEVDREGKIAFLQTLDVLSVPTVYREPKGLFVLEALANGVPVVLPRHGAFPELVEATGGGLLVEPGSPEDLARGLSELLADPDRRAALGRAGREAVHGRFHDRAEAEQTVAVYRRLLSSGEAARATA